MVFWIKMSLAVMALVSLISTAVYTDQLVIKLCQLQVLIALGIIGIIEAIENHSKEKRDE